MHCALEPRMPLAPALSRRERGNLFPTCPASRTSVPDGLSAILPLPAGEGRGEGNLTSHCRFMGRGYETHLFCCFFWPLGLSSTAMATPDRPTILTTNGVRFGIIGGKPAVPAPTLFVFANDLEGTLEKGDFAKVGKILQEKKSFLLAGLDMPAHGQDQRKDEPNGLKGWRARLDQNEDFVAAFVARASTVLDTLVREGYTDPNRVAVAGTSRGGFIALHFAAAESGVRSVGRFV